MNERIRELLQETYTHFGQGKYRTNELVAEKFAELIVKECCDIVRQCRFAPDEDAIVNEIVHHFGVEE